MKWPWVSPYFKLSGYSYCLFCIKFIYSEYSFSYTMLQYDYELYWDPGINGNVDSDIKSSVSYSQDCLFSILYRFMSTKENLLWKMYTEGALMNKSRNIAWSKSFELWISPRIKWTNQEAPCREILWFSLKK